MKRFISKAAREIGVSTQTLRVWHADGLLVPEISEDGTRLYDDEHISKGQAIRRMREHRGVKVGRRESVS